MTAAEIDARLSRKPIERYEWPLGAALAALALSILIGERKRVRAPAPISAPVRIAAAATMIAAFSQFASGAAPGLDAYENGKFNDAYNAFQETLKTHPQSHAKDELQFDSGAAAYKMKDYGKALELFSQALLSPDAGLQSKSHYNLGNTLYQRGEEQKAEQKKLGDWTNALAHYNETLKIEPNNKEAKDNYDYVKKKIDELKNKKKEQPTPTPSPQENKQNQQNQQSQDQQQKGDQGQQQQQDQQQSQNQQSQKEKEQNQEKQPQSKSEPEKSEQSKPSETSSPTPSPGEQKQDQKEKGEGEQPSPTPGPGSPTPATTPTPGENENGSPSPSPNTGEGSGEKTTPSPAPSGSPQKKLAGELKEAGEEKPKADQTAEVGEAEPEKEGQMSESQALALLQSMKDEEARVRLDERKAARHVYKDW